MRVQGATIKIRKIAETVSERKIAKPNAQNPEVVAKLLLDNKLGRANPRKNGPIVEVYVGALVCHKV